MNILEPIYVFFQPRLVRNALTASWWWITAYTVILVVILTGAATYRMAQVVLYPNLKAITAQISPLETIRIEGGRAIYDERLITPFSRTLGMEGGEPFTLIYEREPAHIDYPAKYKNYIHFTSDRIYVHAGDADQSVSYKELETMPFIHQTFWRPITFQAESYLRFLSFWVTCTLYIVGFAIELSKVLFAALMLGLMSFFAIQNKYTLSQNIKCMLYALPANVLIQSIAYMYLSNTLVTVFAVLGMVFQALYAMQALRDQ